MPSSRLKTKPKSDLMPSVQWTFEAIGTTWWIGLYEPITKYALNTLQHAIAVRIEVFDATYSRFRAESLVSHIAQAADTYPFPDDATALFNMYRRLYKITSGAVTPLIGQLLVDAGYDSHYSFRPKPLHTPAAWDDVMHFDRGVLTTLQPVLLDFGAAGKGYLVDIVAEIVRTSGINQYCIDASGDIICSGVTQPLDIGLENPNDMSQVIGVMKLQNAAVCGSAGNRRRWTGYHHIVDPYTLRSPDHIDALWVMAETAFIADALTTALYFSPAKDLKKEFKFEHCIIYADHTAEVSERFPAELFV